MLVNLYPYGILQLLFQTANPLALPFFQKREIFLVWLKACL